MPKKLLHGSKNKRIGIKMKILRDKYFRKKGGEAKFIIVLCKECKEQLFVYQKDQPRGWLKRCYLNRIMTKNKWGELKKNINDLRKMPKLKCNCGSTIGLPIKHKGGRLAYSLIRGKFIRKTYEE